MTAVEPAPIVPETPLPPLSAVERELHEFAMGRTDTLSRDALIAALCTAVARGDSDHPGDLGVAQFATWGYLLGFLGRDVSKAVGRR